MKGIKQKDVSFLKDEKESFKGRLRSLIGSRSVRAAARDWGLSFSTLNNYLTKDTDPALSTIQCIAYKEHVTLDWLVNGSTKEAKQVPAMVVPDTNTQAVWISILSAMDEKDAASLIKLIHLKGVESLLSAAQEPLDVEQAIDKLQIRPTLKQAIKMAVEGDESTDKEILRRLCLAGYGPLPGTVTEVNQEQSKGALV
ncbi:XRE family transcriptional regulator [Serratia symbiotica]|uniref:XRE family transcriptional regulator n=1 Tax=Serratia symbiotica TaxID=138074 RepID=UPI001E153F79|nr:XRE family transcriptional regulator [Serratia symbiotica]NIG88421.1 XRE family transcriptional regulator [Serratia symbiotica]USS95567.1 XRE family transcriptional regulator [Serratia symbiotica]